MSFLLYNSDMKIRSFYSDCKKKAVDIKESTKISNRCFNKYTKLNKPFHLSPLI
jgi:hypothetical protein